MIRFTPFLVCALLAKASFATQTSFTDLERQAGDDCPVDALSCNVDPEVNSCCVETPGGLLLQTQFWNPQLVEESVDGWTIHGLWADYCDGTFDPNPNGCGKPAVPENKIRDVLAANGKQNLLEEMDTFWLGLDTNEHLWVHEWNKHGRCMSTLATRCMPKDSPKGLDAAIFFQRTVDEFKKLTTYKFLADAGIEPDATTTYTLDELESAIQQTHGFIPALDCKGGTLNQISYYFNLKGTIEHGTMVPLDRPKRGSCRKTGIRYPPKKN